MDIEGLIKQLELLNFSKTEASVYITLVKNSKLNGSQIAKILNISRSSVYPALDKLYSKGVAFLLPGESNVYKAQDPEVLLENLKTEYIQTADSLKNELAKFKSIDSEKEYYNIKGYQNFVHKTKELLLQAEKEVYMNTCFDLQIFGEEIREISKRGVRIIVFTFETDINTEEFPIESYCKHIPGEICDYKRMMLVVDYKKVLIAGSYLGREVLGTFTENPLLVAIVSEHIHLDIYLLKLQEKYQDEDFFNGILINSLLETER